LATNINRRDPTIWSGRLPSIIKGQLPVRRSMLIHPGREKIVIKAACSG
jgi:hypothetical protein